MWIDFKLYFYVSNHKSCLSWTNSIHVVNWFQIVFLREQSQAVALSTFRVLSCELISNCIFTWAITSENLIFSRKLLLWIDFKLYFYVSNHKFTSAFEEIADVVNWFQIVFLREQSQEEIMRKLSIIGCELISNCIFTWAITSYY